MAFLVVTGASCKCSVGMSPCTLNAMSQAKVQVEGKPVATVSDGATTNLPSFGMCTTQSNPAVAAATAAAFGVPTPAPCVPVLSGQWVPSGKRPMVAGAVPVLKGDTLMCTYGGKVEIVSEGQTKVSV